MNDSPSPNRQGLTRASIVGIGLGVGGVILFVILWTVLENWGLDQFPRLIIAVCLPPALIALIMGAYFLLIPRSNGD